MKKYIIALLCLTSTLSFAQINTPSWIHEISREGFTSVDYLIDTDGKNVYTMINGPFGVGTIARKFNGRGELLCTFNGLNPDSSGYRIAYHAFRIKPSGGFETIGTYGWYSIIDKGNFYDYAAKNTALQSFNEFLQLESSFTTSPLFNTRAPFLSVDKRTNLTLFREYISEYSYRTGVLSSDLQSLTIDNVYDVNFSKVSGIQNVKAVFPHSFYGCVSNVMVRYDTSFSAYQSYLQYKDPNNKETNIIALPNWNYGNVQQITENEFFYTNSIDTALNYSTLLYKVKLGGAISLGTNYFPDLNWIAHVALVTKDSGCVITGCTYSIATFQSSKQDTSRNAIVLRIDRNGKLLWHHIYGVDGKAEVFYKAAELDDGSVIVGGYTSTHQLLLHYPPITVASVEKQIEEQLNVSLIQSLETMRLDFGNVYTQSNVSIYNVLGELVLLIPNYYSGKSIDTQNLPQGNYFVLIENGKRKQSLTFSNIR